MSILFFIAGIVQYILIRESKNFEPDFLLGVVSYFLLTVCVFLGSLLLVAGIIKIIEVDLRGKDINQIKQEYQDIVH